MTSKDQEDRIVTVDLYQSSEKIHIRRIKGFYRNLRFFGGIFLFAAYFGLLWLDWDGRQAIWFDLPSRQFHLFGITFWPQDLILLSWALIISAFALFAITVFAGRVWCGYTCPQSVWTWIFVFIEEKTEGKRNARIKQDKQPLNAALLGRKALKHLLWVAVALVTAITFVGYFTPIKQLVIDITQWNVGGWSLAWIAFFTLATYGNAGWLREQVCLYMCPYARFQAVMFDKNTLIVSYDTERGEPRGSRKKNQATTDQGDCINCNLCVQVCPTGIDIRDGLQYECISCAACIDACDSVMEQMNYPKGLVRYTTENALSGAPSKILRPRLIGYTLALIIMIIAFSTVLITRVPIELDIMRERNALYQRMGTDRISNSYVIEISNMTRNDHSFKVTLSGLPDIRLEEPQEFFVRANDQAIFPIQLSINQAQLRLPSYAIKITIEAVEDNSLKTSEKSSFFGPTDF